MSKFHFSLNLTAPMEQLMKLAMDYENLTQYLPNQLKSVKIIKKNNDDIITEEILIFKTIFKNNIKQEALHKKIADNKLYTQIISGPAKGTAIIILYEKIKDGTKVDVDIDLKLNLQSKIFQPLIKKWYKTVLIGVLYRMKTVALKSQHN